MALSLVAASLSTSSSRVMDAIQQLGDAVPQDTQDAMLNLMDVVIELDKTIFDTQCAVAYLAENPVRSRRGRRSMEEAAELLQLRAEKVEWMEERGLLHDKLAATERRLKTIQELNTMLMESRRATTPSSGFCSSASHSPRSDDDDHREDASGQSDAADTETTVMTAVLADSAQPLDYTPDFESATFQDSIRPRPRPSVMHRVLEEEEGERTLEEGDLQLQLLSTSPESAEERGPLTSTFKDPERSIYHTPITSKKMRRRSSSLGDVLGKMTKKMFTPKEKKVKNPVLEALD